MPYHISGQDFSTFSVKSGSKRTQDKLFFEFLSVFYTVMLKWAFC